MFSTSKPLIATKELDDYLQRPHTREPVMPTIQPTQTVSLEEELSNPSRRFIGSNSYPFDAQRLPPPPPLTSPHSEPEAGVFSLRWKAKL
ncbi:hypothetical protein JCM6882_006366 [Rhodosporidiobolus microsporus]